MLSVVRRQVMPDIYNPGRDTRIGHAQDAADQAHQSRGRVHPGRSGRGGRPSGHECDPGSVHGQNVPGGPEDQPRPGPRRGHPARGLPSGQPEALPVPPNRVSGRVDRHRGAEHRAAGLPAEGPRDPRGGNLRGEHGCHGRGLGGRPPGAEPHGQPARQPPRW